MDALKNMYNLTSAKKMADAIQSVYPRFSKDRFLANLDKTFAQQELKERVHELASRLKENLPHDFQQSAHILIKTIRQNEQDKKGLHGFLVWPLTEFIARYGLEDLEVSLEALVAMTQQFTSEFAIRPFLKKYPEKVLSEAIKWSRHENEHVRRFASEGTRPLLPWGERLPEFVKNPEMTLPILEVLAHDSSEYVRRSVANHLNDHTKNHADWTAKVLSQWQKNHDFLQIKRLIRHALRTLLKKGHPLAMKTQGYHPAAELKSNLQVKWVKKGPKSIRKGATWNGELILRNVGKKNLKLMADYAVHFQKANGKISAKVFKGAEKKLAPKETWRWKISQSFQPLSTRKYYSGPHAIEPRINGQGYPQQKFQLS